MYVFSNTDPEYITNLRFFVQFAISKDDRCDYVIVVQTDADKATPDLPDLPPNARYLHHANECYDWGTIGWAINVAGVDTRPYSFFIFMNSSVRGPFIPPYAKDMIKWQDVLIGRIDARVKLVGPTISCEGSPPGGRVREKWRVNPHVQSYVLATDQVGLRIWLQDAKVFQCWHSMWDVIWHGELGSSLAILKAGYNLDSLMLRYQGVDWQDHANWACNAQANPYGEHYMDGQSLDPYEVMFVKVKERVLQNDWSFAKSAVYMSRVITDQASGSLDVLSNAYRANPAPFREQRIGYLLQRGPECFDFEYYLAQNSDLSHIKTKDEAWRLFLRGGAFEGRSFRFTCDSGIKAP